MGRTAIAVPEYWPRAHLVALALHADELVLTDSFQYSRQSFQNRARLRTPQGWQWISVPLQARQHGQPISEVALAPREWRRHHLRSLQHHYGTAPFHAYYADSIRELIDRPWRSLGALTCATVKWTLRAFGVSISVTQTSGWQTPPHRLDDLACYLADRELFTASEAHVRERAVFPDARVITYRERERHQNFPGFEAPGGRARVNTWSTCPERHSSSHLEMPVKP